MDASGLRRLLTSLALGAALSVYRGFELPGLSIGPMVAAGVDVGLFSLPNQTLVAAMPVAHAGLHGRAERRGLSVGVSVLAGYQWVGAQLRDDELVSFRTPSVKLTFALSVGWEGL